jgi:tRNA modification GTPase
MATLAAALLTPIDLLLRDRCQGRVFKEGAMITLCGRPNVGKSSLFNKFVGRDRALVSNQPGTTRDGLQEEIQLAGIICQLQDTAGLGHEEKNTDVAHLSQAITREYLMRTDLILLVLDHSVPLTAEDTVILEETKPYQRLLLANKCDLPGAWPLQNFVDIIPCSIYDDTMLALENAILEKIIPQISEPESNMLVVSRRQEIFLQQLKQYVLKIKSMLQKNNSQWELIALELQQCLRILSCLDGKDAPNEVYDQIFTSFCVGK